MSNNLDVRDSYEFKMLSLIAIKEELDRRKGEYLWNYIPHAKQEIFHKSEAKIRLYLGGNRAGKTTAGLGEDAWRALGEHPFQDVPVPSRGWIVGLDRTNLLENVIIPRFFKIIPERAIEHWDKKNSILTLKNGSTVTFKSTDSGDDKFQSDDVDWIHFDEEPPQNIYKESLFRTIDRKGKIYLTMTPTNGISWSYDELYLKCDHQRIEVVECYTTDNPHLPQDEVKEIMSNLTEEERAMRIQGKYVSVGVKKVFPYHLLEKVRPDIKPPIATGELLGGKFVHDPSGALSIWEEPGPYTYYAGVDCSEGITDPSAVEIWRFEGGKFIQVAEYDRVIDPEVTEKRVRAVLEFYNDAFATIERNSAGLSLITRLISLYDNLFLRETHLDGFNQTLTSTVGWHTDRGSKRRMITDFRDWMKDQMVVRSEKLWRQMENYIEDKREKLRAQYGHDDCLIAAMLSLQGYLSGQHEPIIKRDYDNNLKVNKKSRNPPKNKAI